MDSIKRYYILRCKCYNSKWEDDGVFFMALIRSTCRLTLLDIDEIVKKPQGFVCFEIDSCGEISSIISDLWLEFLLAIDERNDEGCKYRRQQYLRLYESWGIEVSDLQKLDFIPVRYDLEYYKRRVSTHRHTVPWNHLKQL